MGKKNLLVMAASIFLATANALTATAQEVGGVEISKTSILPITGVTAATDLSSNSDGADGVIGGHEYVDLGLPSGTLWVSRFLVGINFRHPNVMPNFAVWKTITYRHWHRWCCQPRF